MIWRRIGGALAAAILAIVVVGYGYAFASWAGARIPVNRAWTAPGSGTIVYVEDNGVHTSIVLAKAVLPPALLARLRPEHLSDPRFAWHDHVAFGWGERGFYLDTPTWADLSPRTVLRAAFGSDATLMHVEHIARPQAREGVAMVRLRPAELARLIEFIAASFDSAGGPPIAGYGAYDAFYPARGHYDAVTTCNEWTGEAFRHAGVTFGAWTPFSQGVMQWLEPLPTD